MKFFLIIFVSLFLLCHSRENEIYQIILYSKFNCKSQIITLKDDEYLPDGVCKIVEKKGKFKNKNFKSFSFVSRIDFSMISFYPDLECLNDHQSLFLEPENGCHHLEDFLVVKLFIQRVPLLVQAI